MKKLQGVNLDGKKGLFVFLDFDGTLSKIVSHPKDAVIEPHARKWLKKLLKSRNTKVAIVTGRSLPDIRRKIRLNGLYYIANHGMEIFHNGRLLLRLGHQFEKPLKSFGGEMQSALAHIHGVFIEKKGLSVAIHFRGAEKKYHSIIKKITREWAKPLVKRYNLRLTKGKMVLELRPARFWDKGKGVRWLWKKTAPKFFPVYAGDDVTDEDAFKRLKPHGLTIRIGKKIASHAHYSVPSIKSVIKMVGSFSAGGGEG